jgi:alkylation response protein AidB-like acyl-CoA dehydrogenase
MTLVTDTATDIAQSIARIRELQPALASGGAEADATNTDPTSNFDLLAETGIYALYVPEAFGGAWDGTLRGQFRQVIEAQIAVSAGDGPTGQNWGTTTLTTREIFNEHNDLPDDTKREIARRLLDEGVRICAANAVTGLRGPAATAKRVDGGILVNGSKSFVTNSGGQGLALVGLPIEGEPGVFHALVELSGPGVVNEGDWDVMGQRGTQSNTYTFNDVFVSDGWFFAGHAPTASFLAIAFLLHAGLNQGIGEGGFAALKEYASTMKRGSLPQFATPAEDPLIKRTVGALSGKLAASRALLLETASRVETEPEQSPAWHAIVAAAASAKVQAIEASLAVGTELFDVAGARATSNRYRYDRFWRNARTFASHDPTDAKNVMVGGFELTGALTDLPFITA